MSFAAWPVLATQSEMEHDGTNVTKIWLKAQAAQLTSTNPGNFPIFWALDISH